VACSLLVLVGWERNACAGNASARRTATFTAVVKRHRYDLVLRTDQDAFLPVLARYRPSNGAAFGETGYNSDTKDAQLPAIAVRGSASQLTDL